MEPGNKYIEAIIGRVQALRNLQENSSVNIAPGGGIDAGATAPEAGDPIDTQVRILVAAARGFMKNGNCRDAFEALMSAYLLEPTSPEVIECEKIVLPAWNLARKQNPARRTLSAEEMLNLFSGIPPEPSPLQRLEKREPTPDRRGGLQNAVAQALTDEQRVEFLRQQKEAERLRHELLLWREASNLGT